MTILLLVVGLAGSALAGLAWAHHQGSLDERSFQNTASSLQQSVRTALQRDLDFQTSLQELVATTPGLTNHQLGPWLQALDLGNRYKGSVAFAFVQRVPSDQLDAYEAAVTSDPQPGKPPGPYSPSPPGQRAFYCLPRLGIQLTPIQLPPAVDLCAPTQPALGPSPVAAVMERVATTGQTEAYSLRSTVDTAEAHGVRFPAGLADAYRDLLLVVSPVYAEGNAPGSPTIQPQRLLGWIAGSYSGNALITSAFGATHDLAARVTTSTGTVLASGGPRFGGARRSVSGPAEIGLHVSVTGPTSSAPALQGVAVGLVGVLLLALLVFFFFHMGRSRDRALRTARMRTDQLRHQALHDPLTGLPNRDLLFDRAEQMMARSQYESRPAAALYLDLDNFKDVNDSFGHTIGDHLLKAVANRVKGTIRSSDTVGRLGGDDFLVLTEGDSQDLGPELLAERILSDLAEPFALQTPRTTTLTVRASIGIATGMRTRAEELIRDADVALHQAKEAGKARYVVFRPEMQTAIRGRLNLEMDLHHALENDELFVMYQPIFDLTTMATKGVEALVRWHHPTRGVVPPEEFIPVAEQSGLIVPIGRLVLNQACEKAAAWWEAGYSMNVSVNVSASQLQSASFVDDVGAALEGRHLSPAALTLEITESLLMRDTIRTASVLRDLKALGVRIAVDDFGTGYSSLAYLRQFPIDSLKIDRSFIAKASDGPESTVLVHTLIRLGKALGIETVAEGVEHETQLTLLQEEHCDSGQGFLFSPPLHAEVLLVFLSATAEGRRPVSGWRT